MMSLRGSMVSLYDSMVSLHDSKMSVMFIEALDQPIGGFYLKNIRSRHICAVPIRSKCAGKKNFLICPFKKNLKKWNSILTILSLPFEFEQYRQRKMALGTNGLMNYIVAKFAFLILKEHHHERSTIPVSASKQQLN
jgi:hypothetical protein